MRSIVVIPTYNKCENIAQLITAILDVPGEFDIVVVDDNSSDGTADAVRSRYNKASGVNLIHHQNRYGFGPSCIDGFRFALEHGYDAILSMDADFSHDPADLPMLKDALKNTDFVIGSRYCGGSASVVNWSRHRLYLSRFAGRYVRAITGIKISDPTSGFRAFKSEVLKAINLDTIRSTGYAFQIETLYRAHSGGFRVSETPIVFTERKAGRSKMSCRMILEAAVVALLQRLSR